jgi:hypothetical protein
MFLIVELTTDARYSKKPAIFESSGHGFKLVRDGGWIPETWLKDFISRRPRIGQEIIARSSKGEKIIRATVEVLPTDARYLEAWRQEFERQGFYAEIVDEKRARLWENMRGSGLDRDIQDEVVYGIQRLPDEAVDNIQKELAKIL